MSNNQSNLKDFPTNINTTEKPNLDLSMGKSEYKLKAKQTVDHVHNKIKELESKKDMVKADLMESYIGRVNQLKEEKQDLEKKYNDLLQVADNKWDKSKKSFVKASESFEKGFNELSSIVK